MRAANAGLMDGQCKHKFSSEKFGTWLAPLPGPNRHRTLAVRLRLASRTECDDLTITRTNSGQMSRWQMIHSPAL